MERMRMEIESRSKNVEFARVVAAVFMSRLDPTLEEVEDVKTAVSEAVTNAIVHGYRDSRGDVELLLRLFSDGAVQIQVKDKGRGIPDIKAAMQPMFTTAPEDEERSGYGFTVMESFMDKVRVKSAVGRGTVVTLEKKLRGKAAQKGT